MDGQKSVDISFLVTQEEGKEVLERGTKSYASCREDNIASPCKLHCYLLLCFAGNASQRRRGSG